MCCTRFFIFFVFFCFYSFVAKADIISEYMFNVMTAIGSATTCKEVINNPEGAKQSVVGVIETINKLSPTNKIETSSVVDKFNAILIYCNDNPGDLLINALLKTSGVNQQAYTPTVKPNNANNKDVPNTFFDPQINNKNAAEKPKVLNNIPNRVGNDFNSSENEQKVEFIN